MRIGVTGTPGTGKSTATERLASDLEVIHLNEVIRAEGLSTETDEQRDSLVADLDAVRERLDGREDVVIESHLAHHVPVDRVVVLRCHPEELEKRLRERGEPAATVTENAESEALDVVLSEAVSERGQERVYEIDTTDRDPDEVAAEVDAVVRGDRQPSAGTVSFIDYL